MNVDISIADNAHRANPCWRPLHLLVQCGNLGRHLVGVPLREILQRLPTSIRILDDDLRAVESLLRGVVQPRDVGTNWRTLVRLFLYDVEHRLAEEFRVLQTETASDQLLRNFLDLPPAGHVLLAQLVLRLVHLL